MSDVLVGGVERVTINFADITGTPVDPTGITVTVTQPDATAVTYTLAGGGVINDAAAVGRFYVDHPITIVGTHIAKGVSTSPAAAAITRFVAIA